MNGEKQRLSVDELAVGMYVSELDRPWLETPFLFQGFHIESDEVIDELGEYCEFVVVDVAKCDNSIAIPRNLFNGSKTDNGRAKAKRRKPKPNTAAPSSSPDDTQKLRLELPDARAAHTHAEVSVREMFGKIRQGSTVDVETIHASVDPMIDSIMRNDDAMSWLARMKKKDDYVYDHSISSAVWALIFGKHLGLARDELQILGTGAIFMDVGKTGMPNELLTRTGPLNEEEMQIMRTHVDRGLEIAQAIPEIDERVLQIISCHHERYNGTGYPKGLSGSDIPVFARIAGIVDSYDAMTTPRPYAEPVSAYDAIRQLNNLGGVEFPQEIVEQFVQAIGIFPVGTVVELNSGEVGVVIAQNRVRRLRPKVLLILDADKAPLVHEAIIDLRKQLAQDNGRSSLWIERGLTPGEYGIDPSEYFL